MLAQIILLLPCGYYCSVSPPHGTVRKSACVIVADPGPEVIKLVSCSTEMRIKFHQLIKPIR